MCVDSSHHAVLSPQVQYLRRRKSALGMNVSLLALALLVLTVGLISATRTDNVPVAGYYPGIIVRSLSLSHLPLLKRSPPLKVDRLCSSFSGRSAELRSLSGNRWDPPGGEPQAHGECDATTHSFYKKKY